jgi:hypothetical protein
MCTCIACIYLHTYILTHPPWHRIAGWGLQHWACSTPALCVAHKLPCVYLNWSTYTYSHIHIMKMTCCACSFAYIYFHTNSHIHTQNCRLRASALSVLTHSSACGSQVTLAIDSLYLFFKTALKWHCSRQRALGTFLCILYICVCICMCLHLYAYIHMWMYAQSQHS